MALLQLLIFQLLRQSQKCAVCQHGKEVIDMSVSVVTCSLVLSSAPVSHELQTSLLVEHMGHYINSERLLSDGLLIKCFCLLHIAQRNAGLLHSIKKPTWVNGKVNNQFYFCYSWNALSSWEVTHWNLNVERFTAAPEHSATLHFVCIIQGFFPLLSCFDSELPNQLSILAD